MSLASVRLQDAMHSLGGAWDCEDGVSEQFYAAGIYIPRLILHPLATCKASSEAHLDDVKETR